MVKLVMATITLLTNKNLALQIDSRIKTIMTTRMAKICGCEDCASVQLDQMVEMVELVMAAISRVVARVTYDWFLAPKWL